MPRTERGSSARRTQGRGGSLFLGVLIGLVLGLSVAAGMAWYFYLKPGDFKAAPHVPEVTPSPPRVEITPPPRIPEAERLPLAPAPVVETGPLPTPQADAHLDEPAQAEPTPRKTLSVKPPPAKPQRSTAKSAPPGKSDYTFFDILPGDKPRKPVEARLPREVWWLQVAALREAQDADRLKAKLVMLGLDVHVEKVAVKDGSLHRVRVGPFKTDDDALGALDTLAANQYEPRLLKESVAKP